jgi:hypothetical protein
MSRGFAAVTASARRSLVAALEQLDYADDEGLVTESTRRPPGPRDYVWQDLHTKVGLEAAFFHDGVPLVGFTAETRASNLADIRRRLWNFGKVPLLINVGRDGITAYNAVTNPRQEEKGLLATERRADTAHGLLEAFKRTQVTAGSFARQHAPEYKGAARVDRALLSNLEYLRQVAAGNNPDHRSALDAVTVGLFVASYLADRGILNEGHLENLAGVPTLRDALMGGRRSVRRLFEGLAEHFNGDVFGPIPDALPAVADQDLIGLAALLQGDDLPSGQQSLWPYDFSVLPPDLVGSIYEQLLQESRKVASTYYTPRFLVDILLDEVLPWDSTQRTLIDLASGSGAFMTEAFRRMGYAEGVRLGRKPNYAELAGILKNRIFGVELNPDAARIATFGLYLALLEQLDPPTVWETAVLPKLLDTNVVVSDAFSDHSLGDKKFDAVVSNPPWRSSLTPAAARFIRRTRLPVSDRQQAQAFLWLGSEMLTPDGSIGLVMPARPLLHNRSAPAQAFRAELFTRLHVKAVVDLSAIRRDIFSSAVAPAALLIATPRPVLDGDGGAVDEREEVLHVAPHTRVLNSAIDALTITPEEVRPVSIRQAIARTDIWKVMLWGGPRDLHLIDRLRSSYPTVAEFAVKFDWTTGRGYQVAGGDENDASQLQGLRDVPTLAVDPLYLDQANQFAFNRDYLHRVRNLSLFAGPHVLIRRTVSRDGLAAVLVDDDAVFKDGVIGIAAPRGDRPLLAMLAATIVSSLGHYYHFMTSSSWGVERDLVDTNEHLSLPLATPTDEQLGTIEDVMERSSAGLTAELRGELDDVIFDAYGLTSVERSRVLEGVRVGWNRFRNPKSSLIPIADSELERYGELVRSVLAVTLPRLEISSQVFSRGDFRAVAITLHQLNVAVRSREHEIDIDAILSDANPEVASSTGIVAQPAGLFVDQDTIYVVKTSDPDRWSMDAALDDADRVLAAIAFGR